MHARHSGMTILDLTVTLTLLGLLATAATPLFSEYTQRVRVNRAVGEISRVSIEIENWRTRTRSAVYPETLLAAGIRIAPDPWGNEYTYARVAGDETAARRRDDRLELINTDFDLYSNGPDGVTTPSLARPDAHDDIVRAGNGAFIGRAQDYY